MDLQVYKVKPDPRGRQGQKVPKEIQDQQAFLGNGANLDFRASKVNRERTALKAALVLQGRLGLWARLVNQARWECQEHR